MTPIITKSDVGNYLPAAKNCHSNLEFYIQEEQSTTLRDWLGMCFFSEFEKPGKADEETFNILLYGGFWGDGKKYCEGLRKVLSYLAYGEYVLLNNYTDTPFGTKIKNFEDGLPTPPETLEKLRVVYRNKAISFFETCKEYLCANKEYFCYQGDCPNGCGESGESKTNPRIRVKGRTLYGNNHESDCGCKTCKEYRIRGDYNRPNCRHNDF